LEREWRSADIDDEVLVVCEEYDVVSEMESEPPCRVLWDGIRAMLEAVAGRRLNMKGATGRSRPAVSWELSMEYFGARPVVWNREGDADTSKRASEGNGGLSVATSKLGRDLPDFRLFLRNQLTLFFSVSFSLPFGLVRAAMGDIGSENSSLGKGDMNEGFAVRSRLSGPTLNDGTCLRMPLRTDEDAFGEEPGPTVAERVGIKRGSVIGNDSWGNFSIGGMGTSGKGGGEDSGAVSVLPVSAGSADKPGGSGIGCDTDAGESVSRWCEWSSTTWGLGGCRSRAARSRSIA